MNMPGFTAEAALGRSSEHYQSTTRPSNNQQIIPQLINEIVCGFKAGKLFLRCFLGGFDGQDCFDVAAASYNLCIAYP